MIELTFLKVLMLIKQMNQNNAAFVTTVFFRKKVSSFNSMSTTDVLMMY